MLNILTNFIPHKLIICDDKDPLWFNTNIKSLIHEKNKTCKVRRKNIKNIQRIEELKSLQNCLKCMIEDSKHNSYPSLANKLPYIQKNSKSVLVYIKDF